MAFVVEKTAERIFDRAGHSGVNVAFHRGQMNNILVKKVIRQKNALRIHLVQNHHLGLGLVSDPLHVVWIEIGFHWNIVFGQNRTITIQALAFDRIGHHGTILNTDHISVLAFAQSLDDAL